jgi:hypothetical protein
METVKENKQHEILFRLANQQGVKPTEKIKDLYKNSDETLDVDEFLEVVEEIRKSDEVKNG